MSLRLLSAWGAVVLLAAPALAHDWAHWRGPEQNGISRELNLVDDWSLNPPKNVLWTSDIGGRSTPIVLNDRVYLNCRTSDDVTDPETKINAREQVVCWDAKTGDILWKDVFNVFQTDIPAPRVGWAAMVGDTETGNVYVHSVSGVFRCYDADGKVQWEYSLSEDFAKISGYGGRTQTPIIDEDRVIVSFMTYNWGETKLPPPKQTYYAFDKKTGKLLWISAPGAAPLDTNYSCPIVTVVDGKRMLIGGNSDGGVYAINARTGEKYWGYKMSKRGLNTTPVIANNKVYISHGEDNVDTTAFGRVTCLDAKWDGKPGTDPTIWRIDDIKAGYTALLEKDGILYVMADTGKLYAFDAENGEELWVHEELGTVGKGSPIWADGKIYIMEVNGHIHILKPSREKCETLSSNTLIARVDEGLDEIYASPAISNGRIFFCTRDRMICVGNPEREPKSNPIEAFAKEADPQDEVKSVHLVPYEVELMGTGEVEYELRGYDANGRFVKNLDFTLEVQEDLPNGAAEGNKLVVSDGQAPIGGHVVAKADGFEATSRIRYFPKLDWKYDFEKGVPPVWLPFIKLKPKELDGEKVIYASGSKGRPSMTVWVGPSKMTGYTIQADVLMKEERRRLPNIGIVANRYNLILKGNYGKLNIQSWAPHLRMAKEIRYRSDPDIWYTMKLKVDIADGVATVKGKVWKRDSEEPEAWTIEAVDPHPNTHGSPGLYCYALAECHFDNVIITKDAQ